MALLLLFLVFALLLAALAWRWLSQRRAPLPGAAPVGLGDPAAGDPVARLLDGPKEDKPCLTPIDCVQAGRCAGRCGHH